jgi:hypothetical protein
MRTIPTFPHRGWWIYWVKENKSTNLRWSRMDEHWRFLRTSQDFQTPESSQGEFTNYFPNNDKVTFTTLILHVVSFWSKFHRRAVDSGLIGRFRAIDATEGGNASRSNFQGYVLQNYCENASINTNAYYTCTISIFKFHLLFWKTRWNGDQIKQQENKGYGFTR